MSYRKVVILFMAMGMIYFTGCYYDNEAELYPNDCATQNVTYTQFVRPFIDAGCSCHVKGSINGSVNLHTYNDLNVYIQNGLFMKTIKHESGVSPMPPAVAKRTDCEITKLESWISNGAIEN
jgi:hypothetical protein